MFRIEIKIEFLICHPLPAEPGQAKQAMHTVAAVEVGLLCGTDYG